MQFTLHVLSQRRPSKARAWEAVMRLETYTQIVDSVSSFLRAVAIVATQWNHSALDEAIEQHLRYRLGDAWAAELLKKLNTEILHEGELGRSPTEGQAKLTHFGSSSGLEKFLCLLSETAPTIG